MPPRDVRLAGLEFRQPPMTIRFQVTAMVLTREIQRAIQLLFVEGSTAGVSWLSARGSP